MVLIHIIVLCITALGILLSDSLAFAWMRGSTPVLDKQRIRRLHRWVGFGLTGMIVSGAFLFLEQPSDLFAHTGFYVKIVFVVALVLNSFAINYVSRIATKRSFASLTTGERLPLIVSGAISTFSWLGAFFAAFTLG